MSANPIDQNTTPKPTGSLEELFRHHLGEEAAVPPRPMLWDQIDNSLLIRQNEIYRRRLAATRWVAAASLLLASLAGTGWWVSRDAMLGSSEVATVHNPAATRTGADAAASATAGRRMTAANSSRATTTAAVVANPTTETRNFPTASSAREAVAATTAGRATGFGPVSAAQSAAGRYAPAARYGGSRRFQTAPAATVAAADAAFAARTNPGSATSVAADGTIGSDKQMAAVVATSATPGSVAATAAATGGAAGSGATTTGVAATAPSLLSPASSASALAAEPTGLAARATSLALADAETLPAGLATVTLPAGLATVSVPNAEVPAAIDAHRWHYSTSYMAGAFNPNINFSRKGIEPENDYDPSPAFGTNSPALTEQAATEYRNNLRPGFSQRLAVLATRHLKGHWSLSTGLEVNQATAQSASSTAFVGEQLFDLGQTARPLQTTDFRYRLASVPVEVRYSNPAKRGWSLYGRLGGVVSALLGVRSEVEGNPEATRTYSILSAGTPYRRVLASVRGGAGAQFRAGTGKWALSAGPVADLGLVSLNAHPAQSYLAQSHPYTIGVEAAIEFGR